MGRHHSKKVRYSGIEMKQEANAETGCCGGYDSNVLFRAETQRTAKRNRSNNIDRKPLLR